jgi:hypothetical protein
MKIHQAYFGDKNGSHNLIASSIEDKYIVGYLKLNTDIPASINIDAPYLSGLKINRFFVLTKTMNDLNSERPGMGFSHCIIIPVQLLAIITNLKEVFKLFVDQPVKDVNILEDLYLEVSKPEKTEPSESYNEFVVKLTENKGLVVYLGYEDFENNLVDIWKVLPPQLRSNFSFTISGSPNEIEDNRFRLVHTPENFESRWTKYSVIKKKIVDTNKLEFNKYLTEPDSQASKEFYYFITKNNIEFNEIHQYAPIAKLFNLTKQAIEKPETVILKRVINIISALIPKPENGAILKDQILQLFIKSISLQNTKGIMLMRNMSFDAFINGKVSISGILAKWTTKFVSSENQSFFPEGEEVLQEAYLGDNPAFWKEEIVKAFDMICQRVDDKISVFIWNLWVNSPQLISYTKL